MQLREHPASRAAGDQREPQLRGGTHPQAPQLHADLPEAKTSRRHRRLFQNGSGVSVLHGHDASQPGRPEKQLRDREAAVAERRYDSESKWVGGDGGVKGWGAGGVGWRERVLRSFKDEADKPQIMQPISVIIIVR